MNLADLFSAIDSVKRAGADIVAHPLLHAQRVGGQITDSVRNQSQLAAPDFPDPQNPLQTSSPEAVKRMIEGVMSGPMGFAPAGIVTGFNNPALYETARGMFKDKVPPEEVFKNTGLVRVPTAPGKSTLGQQLDSSQSRIDPGALLDIADGVPMKMKDLLEFPQLFEKYPQIAEAPVGALGPRAALSGATGSWDPSNFAMGIAAPRGSVLRLDDLHNAHSTAIHELQHAVQGLEKWPRGGSPKEFELQSTRRGEAVGWKAIQDLDEAVQTMLTQNGLGPENIHALLPHVESLAEGATVPRYSSSNFNNAVQLIADNPAIMREWKRQQVLQSMIADRKAKSFVSYQRLAGEAQSRAAEAAWNGGKGTKLPMTSLYDVDPNKLIFRGQ